LFRDLSVGRCVLAPGVAVGVGQSTISLVWSTGAIDV
jgi:hypothetical protein